MRPALHLGAFLAALALAAPAVTAADITQNPSEGPPAATASTVESPAIEGRVDPATYRVGPGDEFALRYSDLLDPKPLRVGPAGDLLLPDAGSIPVAGLNLLEVEARVHERLRPYLRGKGFTLSLRRPRRFRLLVLGEVERPGAVTLQAPARASEAVAAAGGVSATGARRGIQVRRGADTLLVDLLLAARAGRLEADPLVFESDALFVPPSVNHLDAFGAVVHPGRYDFTGGDRVTDFLAASGGPASGAALEDASLERFDSDGIRQRVPLRLDLAVAAPGGADDIPLRDGDRLFVPMRAHWHEGKIVVVAGEVSRPGPYPIRSDADRVRSILALAGGFTAEADSAATRVERDWDSASRDTTFLRLARDRDAFLSRADREYVVLSWRERHAVSADVGGLLLAGDPRGDLSLLDGDRIVVPRRTTMVSVQGEVKAPGFVAYAPGKHAGDYVEAAGGYTSRANRGRARVTLASTGRQVGAGEAGPLRAGDVVWVPAKEEKSTWASIRELLTTATQIATVYLVAREATR